MNVQVTINQCVTPRLEPLSMSTPESGVQPELLIILISVLTNHHESFKCDIYSLAHRETS